MPIMVTGSLMMGDSQSKPDIQKKRSIALSFWSRKQARNKLGQQEIAWLEQQAIEQLGILSSSSQKGRYESRNLQ
jgi:hypothetical protein